MSPIICSRIESSGISLNDVVTTKFEVIPENEARGWLEENEELIIGYTFPDTVKGYYLLTVGDLYLLTEAQKETVIATRRYPFPGMKTIVYRNKDGEVHFRITGGVSGALSNLFEAWKNGCLKS